MLALAATSSAQEDSHAERALDGDRRLVVNCFDGEYTQILSNASIDLQGVPISDQSLLMVSENSPYMWNER